MPKKSGVANLLRENLHPLTAKLENQEPREASRGDNLIQ